MQFQVPQFIDVEDRVVGPLTWKQFLYLAAGGGILFVLWFILTPLAWIAVAIFVGGLAVAAAFIKVNGRPFLAFIGSVLGFAVKPRQYIWKQPGATSPSSAERPQPAHQAKPTTNAPLAASKIRELAWALTAKKEQPR